MDLHSPGPGIGLLPPGAHGVMHMIADALGHRIGEETPDWMHPVLHIVLFWGPVAMLLLIAWGAWSWMRSRLSRRRGRRPARPPAVPGLEPGLFGFILRRSRRDQAALTALGLLAMPVLYATLELPKLIVNNAIDADRWPVTVAGVELDQLAYLFSLSGLYLLAILVNGGLKFGLNVYKGRVGERLVRRLRLTSYRLWRRGGARGSDVIPVIAQEIEPVGGFASEAFALPVFQGGTFATILVFMFVQDPVLGAAAISLLPIQLALVPRLQRRVNRLARRRMAEMRRLGGELGAQVAASGDGDAGLARAAGAFRRIERIRRDLQRTKFLMKALVNFLTALTPFFFYSIGGWLVIEGRLSLGALVAVLAAYKDFSAPLRELLRYYQTWADVRVRYAELLGFLSQTGARLPAASAAAPRPALEPAVIGGRS
jgi:ABC-type multidrug transport system fused ATPase/permease subunit